MYDLDVLFSAIELFILEAKDSSNKEKKGNKSAGKRARSLSTKIAKQLKDFRAASIKGNV